MSRWLTVYRWAWMLLGGLLGVGLLGMFWPQFRQYRAYQRREAELNEVIRREEEMIKQLQQQYERIQHDPEFAERVAHDMGLARPDETIFRFEDEGHPPPPAR